MSRMNECWLRAKCTFWSIARDHAFHIDRCAHLLLNIFRVYKIGLFFHLKLINKNRMKPWTIGWWIRIRIANCNAKHMNSIFFIDGKVCCRTKCGVFELKALAVFIAMLKMCDFGKKKPLKLQPVTAVCSFWFFFLLLAG